MATVAKSAIRSVTAQDINKRAVRGTDFGVRTPKNHWKRVSNQRHFFDATLVPRLGIANAADWYNVTSTDVKRLGGRSILRNYGDSLPKALKAIYPRELWESDRFKVKAPRGYWQDTKNVSHFLEIVGTKLRIDDPYKWYSVTHSQLSELGGSGMLSYFPIILDEMYPMFEWDWSLFASKSKPSTVYIPEGVAKNLEKTDSKYRWEMWRAGHSPAGRDYWASKANQREMFDALASKFNISTLSQWYNIKASEVMACGAGIIVSNYYNSSLIRALQNIYPGYTWHPWKFEQVPAHFWKIQENQRNFIKYASVELKINNMNDWYNVDASDIEMLGGFGLLRHFGSLKKALYALYPQYNWSPRRFPERTKLLKPSRWDKIENQFNFIKQAEKELRIYDLRQWYSISLEDIRALGGVELLRRFGSMKEPLQNVYPEYDWMPWLFDGQLAKNYWTKQENVNAFLSVAKTQLKITSHEQWCRVAIRQLSRLGAGGLISYWPQIVKRIVPLSSQNIALLENKDKRAVQKFLVRCTADLFPKQLYF